ncbi:MAG: hypothetical protein IKX76_02575, partial [Eubacterium sp.]|nr:hypothetical protein [Eubacterium sp.]
MKKVFKSLITLMLVAALALAPLFSMGVSAEEADIVYASVTLPYADFFYGEINDIAPDLTVTAPDLTTADPVQAAGYREEGVYDTFTSASK